MRIEYPEIWCSDLDSIHVFGDQRNRALLRHFHQRLLAQIADVDVLITIESEAQAKAASIGELLDALSVLRDSIDLSGLAASVHRAIACHGNALGMIKALHQTPHSCNGIKHRIFLSKQTARVSWRPENRLFRFLEDFREQRFFRV